MYHDYRYCIYIYIHHLCTNVYPTTCGSILYP